ncbi:hypothetical protein [Burkholderia stagnalis]|uniref:hypothetical protein n=1 Tax=Burkholderia stagnalis TaxID=1503054 RepID=UPI000F5F79DC|nr:hypothetical protein [Burkholderia stagnalis]RQX89632.1 hypothetical protein DF121_30820 [Burkholderia stagnalis]
MSIQSYDIQIPAGGAQTLEAGGQIFDFLSSGSAFDQIQVLPEFQQGNVTLRLGQGFDAGAIVNRWYIKNPGTTAVNGTIVLSTAGFRNFRISGDVNVLDGGKSRTLAGSAFMANMFAPAVAGDYPQIQLWNPAASGKRAIIEQIQVNATVTGAAQYWFKNAVLSTSGGTPASKLAGSATASAMQLFYQDPAAYETGQALLGSAALSANQTVTIKLTEPLVLMPGYGFTIQQQVQNSALQAVVELYEEPNT